MSQLDFESPFGEVQWTDALQRKIFAAAIAHGDQFLLPRRYGKRLYGEPSETDRKYEACETLVSSGHARWLPSLSNYAPGIVLTGKPLDQ